MKMHMLWTIGGSALVVVALNLGLSGATAYAQSPVVFMTVDNLSQSFLVRFNSGSEVFSVTTPTANAFQGVAPLGNDLLVADYVGEAIQRFSISGAYLGQFASFANPVFLETDSSGNVYTDNGGLFGSPSVTRFNSAGVITQTYSHANLVDALGVDADAAGNVYVASQSIGSAALVKFAANGTFINSINLPFSSPYDLAIDEVGQRLYIATDNGGPNAIRVYDISGEVPTALPGISTPSQSDIVGVHFSPQSGTVFATSFSGTNFLARGFEYTTSGTLLAEYFAADAVEALDITTPNIPEPGTLVLFVLGMAGLGLRALRERD